jgi:putative endonuclease
MKFLINFMIRYLVTKAPIVSTTDRGRQAEQAAATYLAQLGFRVIDRNWSIAKICEIDLIALKAQRAYFIEVKYRISTLSGSGLSAITPQKLRHMRRAAQLWVEQHNFRGDYDVAAIEVSGSHFTVGTFIESIY